ncbi:MAG TPA: T9SS type A sorting domain-containing protein [Flavipsychrobacter sp.]|jgi:hypothetical protein|nr:T9SS type A sorting domain-containing protein [Flavipsychrobacter sp.]
MKSFILSSCLGFFLPFLLAAQSTPLYTCKPVGMTLSSLGVAPIFDYIPPIYSQLLYKHSDFPSIPIQGVITDLYVQLRTKTPKGFKLDNLTIQMGMTNLCGFTMSMHMQKLPMITAGMDTVFYDSSYVLADSIPAGAWWRVPLQQPFHYDFSTGSIDSCKNLLLEIYGRGEPAFEGATFAVPGMEPKYYGFSTSERHLMADSATKHYTTSFGALYMIGFNPKPDPVGVKEVSNSQITIYPNPTKGYLYLSSTPRPNTAFSITDITGRQLLQGVVKDNSISVQSLQPGLYLLRIGTEVLRFVKEE